MKLRSIEIYKTVLVDALWLGVEVERNSVNIEIWICLEREKVGVVSQINRSIVQNSFFEAENSPKNTVPLKKKNLRKFVYFCKIIDFTSLNLYFSLDYIMSKSISIMRRKSIA